MNYNHYAGGVIEIGFTMKKILFYFIIAATYLILIKVNANNKKFIEIPEVKVHAIRGQRHINNHGILNTQVIQHRQLKQSGARHLTDALAGKSGIQLHNTSSNPGEATVSIRGFGENAYANSLILVDGFPLVNPDIGSVNLDFIPVEDIDRLEIIPGSGGVLYGDQAVGGVVNIIMHKPTKFRSFASANYGSYTQRQIYGSVEDAYKNGWFYHANISKQASHNYRQQNRVNTTNGFAQLGKRVHHGIYYLESYIINQRLQLPGALTRLQVGQDRRQVAPTSIGDFSNDTTNLTIFHFKQGLNSHWELRGQMAQRYGNTDGFLVDGFTQRRRVFVFLPRLIGHFHTSAGELISTSGFDTTNDRYRYFSPPLPTFNANVQRRMHSIYTHMAFPINAKLEANLGIRWARNQNDLNGMTLISGVFVSEQGLVYKYNKHWHFYARRAGNYRFPKADELNNVFPSPTISQLRTQTGVSYETGVVWAKPTYSANVSFYQLDLKDEIAFAPPAPEQPIPTNRNLDPTRRRGIITSFMYAPIPALTLHADYAFVSALYRRGPFKGNRIPFVAQNVWRIAGDYYFNPHWSLFLAALFTGSRYASEDDANVGPLFGGFTIYNLSLNYHYKQLNVAFHVNNITGKEYYDYILFPSGFGPFFYPAPERNFLLTVTYEFA